MGLNRQFSLLIKFVFVLNLNFLAIDESAAAYVEQELKSDFRASDFDQRKIKVLLTFKNQFDSKRFLTRSELQRKLLSHSAKTQPVILTKLFRRPFKNEDVKSLWILNGAFVNLTGAEIKMASRSDLISGVFLAEKKFQLPAPIQRSSTKAVRANYTYGLMKIGIAETQSVRPDLIGTGVRVGVLDTGIDPNHPDLKGKIVAYKDFSPAASSKPTDEFGHGTHVAGTIAGSATSGLSIGAAPKVDLIIGRIFDRGGDSTREGILLAMQWMADPDGNPATNDFAQVVNSSWGDSDPYDQRESVDEPFCQIIDSWIQLGIVPIFSAGNSGPSAGTIGLPGGCPGAIAVGATEINDRLMYFSSSGPARWKSTALTKPDFVAPGFNIKSAQSGGGYEEMSGTSMAAPHVTGAVAILLQANPLLNVQEVIDALKKGAKDLGTADKDNDFGWGRIDVNKSL